MDTKACEEGGMIKMHEKKKKEEELKEMCEEVRATPSSTEE